MWKEKFRTRRHFVSRREQLEKVNKSKNLARYARIGFISLIAIFLFSFIGIPLLAFSLPTPDKVVRREGFSTKITDRNGEALYDIFIDQRRTPVSFDDIPLHLRQATIAIEDKNFYQHQGFDPFGLARGFLRLFTRGRAQGGSTLTQQLVKNVLLTSERTMTRKIREFVLAVQIERKYSKDEILQMYLNEAPYGGTAWGVETASQIYFGKSVKEIKLVESAFLAGLPQRPTSYSPYSSTPTAYVARTENVLRRMKEDGFINAEEEEKANEDLANIKFQDRGSSFKAPHFVQYIQKTLEERYGEQVIEQGGLRVTTTLDLKLQEEFEKIIKEEIEKVSEKYHITNGAAVAIDPQTGEILAMVGSKDFHDKDYDGQYNVATALRQPGSAIKPVTYVTGLKKGFTASTLLMDLPTEFPGGASQPPYKPVNYDGKYRGPVQVRYALGNSLNIPAVKMLALVGIKNTLQTAYDLGINSLEPTKENMERFGLSLTLGGGEVKLLELTGAFGSFANTGFRVEPVGIVKVEDANGRVLEEVKPKSTKRVLSKEQAFIMADMLSDNSARSDVFGANSQLNIPGRAVTVKTGTTNDKKDNWSIGGTPQVIVGVWVGNNDNSSMKQVASGTMGASPIWRRAIMKALEGKPNVSFERPDGIVEMEVDVISGYRAHDGYASRKEYFVPGTEPGDDPVHLKLKVCKNDGKLATPGDIASGNYEEKEYFAFKEEDPAQGAGGTNKWQESIITWAASKGDWRYYPPTDYCGATNPVSVDFVNPSDRSSNLPKQFNVRLRADSTADINEVRLELNGQFIRSFSVPPFEYSFDLKEGTYELRAVARDTQGREADRRIKVGVGVAWDYVAPSPTAAPTIVPSATPSPTPSSSPIAL